MQPQLFNFNGQPALDSREVAKMIDKRHRDLIRDIRRYISDMTPSANCARPNSSSKATTKMRMVSFVHATC